MFFIPGQLIAALTFPGVIVHEMAHQLFCRLFRVAVLDVCYFRFGPAGLDWRGTILRQLGSWCSRFPRSHFKTSFHVLNLSQPPQGPMPPQGTVRNGMARSERPAVGANRGAASCKPGATEGWASPCGPPQVLRRDPVDPVDRGSLERTPAAVRQPNHVLATPSAMGRGRHAARVVARLSRRSE